MKFAKGDLVHDWIDPRKSGVMRIENPDYDGTGRVVVEGGAILYEAHLIHVRYGFNMTAEHIGDIEHAMAAILFQIRAHKAMQPDVDHVAELERAYQFFRSMIDLPVVTTDGTQEGRNVQN